MLRGIIILLSLLSAPLFAQTGPYYCGASCDCISSETHQTVPGGWVAFRTDDEYKGRNEHNNRCKQECQKYGHLTGSSPGVYNPCSWSAGRVCSVAHSSAKGTWTYWYWNTNKNVSYNDVCNDATQALAKGSNGMKPTSLRYTWFIDTEMTAVAYCQNGTWKASGKGIQAFQKVNELRKKNGGKACVFDRG